MLSVSWIGWGEPFWCVNTLQENGKNRRIKLDKKIPWRCASTATRRTKAKTDFVFVDLRDRDCTGHTEFTPPETALHDCFLRGEVSVDKKGCNWRIHPTFIADFRRGDFSRHKFSQLHTAASSLERRYAMNPHLANADVNQGTRCYICESAGFVFPSPCLLRQFQRQGMLHPQIPRYPWRPGIL